MKEIGHLEDPGIDGRAVLKWILKIAGLWGMCGLD